MLGTLNGALEVRGLTLPPDAISATAAGTSEVVDGVIRLTAVEVAYALRVPAGSRETVERALARHQEKCPMAATLKGAVAVTWRADITTDGT